MHRVSSKVIVERLCRVMEAYESLELVIFDEIPSLLSEDLSKRYVLSMVDFQKFLGVRGHTK